jgi:hypothetical protein
LESRLKLCHYYSKGLTYTTMVSKVTVAIIWPDVTIVSKLWPRSHCCNVSNNDLDYHCRNNVLQQWSLAM